jgi:hypothetical protein
VQSTLIMSSRIEVTFHGTPHDVSLEAAVDRWVWRLEDMMRDEIETAAAIIERAGRRTMVSLMLALANGISVTAATEHLDSYVAVSNAFRDVRRALTDAGASPSRARKRIAPSQNYSWTWLATWWRQ